MNNTEETLDFEQKHKEDLQRLRGFRLLDDDFMSKEAFITAKKIQEPHL